ncbi:MAG TPA: SRPBCC domain-containing protein [Streptosporangiaceae bacterium]|jgi:uncharacterized protein YndB with AHSA1/START domain|nr:SRPBCC domain-containing protein [Streptosporangiaceae bacterium]
MARQFEVRREVELPATPEQVWAAVATGAGIASWLFPVGEGQPTRVGEEWGGHVVQAFDPPHRYVVRAEGENGFFNALEYVIEAREGGTAVLRYVHSGIFTDDWDDQFDGVSQHTDFYLHSLAQYLRYFDGRAVTYVAAEGPEASKSPGAFDEVRRALGLSADSTEGQTVRVAVPGTDAVEGVVDYARPNFIGVRTADGLYRFYGRNAFGMPVGLGHHLFAPGADQQKTQLAWTNWLDGLFA